MPFTMFFPVFVYAFTQRGYSDYTDYVFTVTMLQC